MPEKPVCNLGLRRGCIRMLLVPSDRCPKQSFISKLGNLLVHVKWTDFRHGWISGLKPSEFCVFSPLCSASLGILASGSGRLSPRGRKTAARNYDPPGRDLVS